MTWPIGERRRIPTDPEVWAERVEPSDGGRAYRLTGAAVGVLTIWSGDEANDEAYLASEAKSLLAPPAHGMS